MCATSTPNLIANKSAKKRYLSSPEFITELKKNKVLDLELSTSDPPVNMSVNMDEPGSGYGSLQQSSLNPGDVKLIADAVRDSFRSDLRGLIKEIAEVLVTDITSGVVGGLKNEIAELKAEIASLRAKVAQLENSADAAEQYSCRNCLRIAGYKEVEAESTDSVVLDVARTLEVDISLDDIDCSHRVGKKIPNKPCDIIVKFTSYRSRNKFYRARIRAKDKPKLTRVFVNEDLTRIRNHLLYECRILVKSKLITGAWSSDGTILIKDKSGKIHRIEKAEDLVSFKSP